MTDIAEKIKELLMWCDCLKLFREMELSSEVSDYLETGEFTTLLAQQLAPEIEKMIAQESWSKALPNKQGYWWQWDGDDDSAPMIWSVLFCGTSNDYFCALGQNGLRSAVDCREMGGWWKFCPITATPNSELIPKGRQNEDAAAIAKQLAPEIEKLMPRWVSVSDRLPEKGQVVDAWGDNLRIPDVEFHPDKWLYYSGYHDDGGMVEVPITVTHWMPIPKGPMV